MGNDIHQIDTVYGPQNPIDISLRCPTCRHQATLDEFVNVHDLRASVPGLEIGTPVRYGQRRCPNPECGAHVFVVFDETQRKVHASYPPEIIDFDATELPAAVLSSLEEAIQCHAAGAYRASAIMVRRTLEDLCADNNATGGNLKERLQALSAKVVLPKALLDGLDNLRLLGNDAAHIEAQTYAQVGEEEVVLAIDITKEVLKAVYQYGSLIDRLNALKKP
jgi:hypothetical protein